MQGSMTERVDEALERAAEQVEVLSHQPHLTKLHAYLAGWAEAVRALEDMNHIQRDDMKCAGCDAIRRFTDAMLGGSDG